LTQQGINAMERGDWKRAESLLSRAVQTSASDVDARRNYAETLWRRGATQDALVHLEEARRLAVEDPSLAVRTGELHLALGQVSLASQLADEALRLDPRLASAWALRGRVESADGQLREALADYQRSLGYAPDDREVALRVAETYRQLNQPQRALLALQSLADRYPPGEEPQQVLYLQGLAMSALGRHDDAAQTLSLAAHRERATPEILFRLAEAELLAGRYAAAQEALQHALAMDPQYAPSRALAARMAVAQRGPQAMVR
jgi:tetratricopeptide (TPR) repeat protein